MKATKFVSYLRVSTQRQKRSGLGLEAQRESVRSYMAANNGRLLAEFIEAESGKHDNRPKLQEALHRARVTGSTLIVAKLDRLSRNAGFLITLRDSGVDFVAADIPAANSMVVGIMALVAQQEREAISARTKAALQAAKRRGVKLGGPLGAKAFGNAGNKDAVASLRRKADSFATDIQPIIADIQAGGITTLQGIADELNAREIETARGGQWHPMTVRNMLERIG